MKSTENFIENNKYPLDIMKIVRQWLGGEEDDTSLDTKINGMSKNEVFECVCEWDGLIGYAGTIKSWITSIYKVDLDS